MTVDNLLQGLDSGIYRTVSTGSGFKLLTGDVQSQAGNRTNPYSTGHLKIFQFDAVVLRTVCPCQYQNVVIIDIFLLIGKFQELFIHFVQLLLIQLYSQYRQTILQGCTSATGCQYDGIIINTHIMRVNDFVSLYILQHTILVDTRRMGKSIATYNSLVGLHRHVHQAGHHTAGWINLLCIDVGLDFYVLVTFDNHRHFLKRSIAGTFTNTIDGYLHLAGTIQYASHCIGSSHAQVIVAMSRNNGIMNTVDMFHQISYLRAILIRQAIPRCIGNIHHSRTCLDNSFYHPCQIFIIRSACIFGIELYIIHILTCILYGSHCTLYYFLAIGIKFIFNVRVRCTDTSMDTFMLGKLQSLCRHINIFLYGTCQGTDGGPCHSF